MSDQHTPEPWTISKPTYDEAEQNRNDNPDERDHDLSSVFVSGPGWDNFASVVVIVNGEPDTAGMANAFLIWAAPMYHRCMKEIDGILKEYADGNVTSTDAVDAIESAMLRTGRIAIAIARATSKTI